MPACNSLPLPEGSWQTSPKAVIPKDLFRLGLNHDILALDADQVQELLHQPLASLTAPLNCRSIQWWPLQSPATVLLRPGVVRSTAS